MNPCDSWVYLVYLWMCVYIIVSLPLVLILCAKTKWKSLRVCNSPVYFPSSTGYSAWICDRYILFPSFTCVSNYYHWDLEQLDGRSECIFLTRLQLCLCWRECKTRVQHRRQLSSVNGPGIAKLLCDSMVGSSFFFFFFSVNVMLFWCWNCVYSS